MKRGLADMLRTMAEGDDDDEKVKILPEAAILQLRETFCAYVAPTPFAPGDLVTPKRNSDVKGAGDPHIVLEVGSDLGLVVTDDFGSNTHGVRPTMRVAGVVKSGRVSAWWVEGWKFEHYRDRLA